MKRILVSLVIAVFAASSAMAVTGAYFTAQGSSDNNTIAAGTLTLLPGQHASNVIAITNLEPGVWKYNVGGSFTAADLTLVPTLLNIQNTGTIDFKYKFGANFVSQSVGGLWELLWVRAYRNEGGTYVQKYQGLLKDMDLGSSTVGVGILSSGSSHDWKFDLALDSSANNTYQGANASFNIVVDATQVGNPGWTP